MYICIYIYIDWHTGAYTFQLKSDDGSKLYVDNKMAIDNDGLHGMKSKDAQKTLVAGERTLTIVFFEKGGGAGCLFQFKGPDTGNIWSYGRNYIFYAMAAAPEGVLLGKMIILSGNSILYNAPPLKPFDLLHFIDF